MAEGKEAVTSEHPLTFQDIVRDQRLLDGFREFLEKSHCAENLMFYFEHQFFRNTTSLEECLIEDRAKQLYERFFMEGAPFELNIDAADRKKLHSSVATGANRFTFQNAYEAVAMLLTNDSVPKFLRSRVYKALKEQLHAEDMSKKGMKERKKVRKIQAKMALHLEKKAKTAETEVFDADGALLEVFAPKATTFSAAELLNTAADHVNAVTDLEVKEQWLTERQELVRAVRAVLPLHASASNSMKYSENWRFLLNVTTSVLVYPLNRTVVGFVQLIVKEFLSWSDASMQELALGNSGGQVESVGSMKLGRSSDARMKFRTVEDEAHFMHFLDVVIQMQMEFPARFEFSLQFLKWLTQIFCRDMEGTEVYDYPGDIGAALKKLPANFRNEKYDEETEMENDVDVLLPSNVLNDSNDDALDRSVWDLAFDDWQQSLCAQFMKETTCAVERAHSAERARAQLAEVTLQVFKTTKKLCSIVRCLIEEDFGDIDSQDFETTPPRMQAKSAPASPRSHFSKSVSLLGSGKSANVLKRHSDVPRRRSKTKTELDLARSKEVVWEGEGGKEKKEARRRKTTNNLL